MRNFHTLLLTLFVSTLFTTTVFCSVEVTFNKEVAINEGFELQIGNLLQWETHTELNLTNFVVERSFDGENFKAIGDQIEAKGSGADYSFVDLMAPKGTTFYRLKYIGTTTSNTYSKVFTSIRQIDNDITFESFSSLTVYDLFTVQYSSAKSITIQYKVTDMNGNIIAEDSILSDKGENEYIISLKNQAPGNYKIQFINQEEIDEVVVTKV